MYPVIFYSVEKNDKSARRILTEMKIDRSDLEIGNIGEHIKHFNVIFICIFSNSVYGIQHRM